MNLPPFNHFTVKEVKSGIFLFEFKEQYEMAMHFLRYQEFYESPSPKIRGQHFTIFEFMKWYSEAFGDGSFTYARDWSGFNVPSNIFEEVRAGTTDHNIYDGQMMLAHDFISVGRNYEPFYVIGATKTKHAKDNTSVLRHEVAHGFFCLDEQYRETMTILTRALPKKTLKVMHAWLKKVGYTPEVYTDEIQAYFATGIPSIEYYTGDKKKFDLQYVAPFQKAFKKKYK